MSAPHENRATTSSNVQKTPTRHREHGSTRGDDNSTRNHWSYQAEQHLRGTPISRYGLNQLQTHIVLTSPLSSPPMLSSGPQSPSSSIAYSHLPTPQRYVSDCRSLGASYRRLVSPNNAGSYLGAVPRTPESPLPTGYISLRFTSCLLLKYIEQVSNKFASTHGSTTFAKDCRVSTVNMTSLHPIFMLMKSSIANQEKLP